MEIKTTEVEIDGEKVKIRSSIPISVGDAIIDLIIFRKGDATALRHLIITKMAIEPKITQAMINNDEINDGWATWACGVLLSKVSSDQFKRFLALAGVKGKEEDDESDDSDDVKEVSKTI